MMYRHSTVITINSPGSTTDPEAITPAADLATLAKQANEIYERGDAALRAGDLALYAEEMKKLKEVLDQRLKVKKLP